MKIMFATIVIVTLMNGPPVQIEDQKGPWDTTYECFMRGVTLIRETVMTMPVLTAHTVCVDTRPPAEKKGRPI